MKSTRRNLTYNSSLINHLVKIENPWNYLNYYTIEYIKNEEEGIKQYRTTEFTYERAEYKGWVTRHFFKGEIINYNKYNIHKERQNEKKILQNRKI